MVGAAPPRGYRRVAWECGFRWALALATRNPAVPPDRDIVTLRLSVAEARAALALDPDEWWRLWSRGWVAGLDARDDPPDTDGA